MLHCTGEAKIYANNDCTKHNGSNVLSSWIEPKLRSRVLDGRAKGSDCWMEMAYSSLSLEGARGQDSVGGQAAMQNPINMHRLATRMHELYVAETPWDAILTVKNKSSL